MSEHRRPKPPPAPSLILCKLAAAAVLFTLLVSAGFALDAGGNALAGLCCILAGAIGLALVLTAGVRVRDSQAGRR